MTDGPSHRSESFHLEHHDTGFASGLLPSELSEAGVPMKTVPVRTALLIVKACFLSHHRLTMLTPTTADSSVRLNFTTFNGQQQQQHVPILERLPPEERRRKRCRLDQGALRVQ
jgi:hypothetical protein